MKLLGLVLAALVVAGCGCKASGTGGKTGPGSGTGSDGTGGDPAACAGLEAHVADLYRASAERTKLTDGEIADNVAMVLGECREAPDRVIACAERAAAVDQLERQCLQPLDDDGSEGERFRP